MAGKGNSRRVLMLGAELKESEKLYSSTSVLAYFRKFKDMAYKHRLDEKKYLDNNDRYRHLTKDKSEVQMITKDKNDSWKQRGRDQNISWDKRQGDVDRDYSRSRHIERERTQERDRERVPDKDRVTDKDRIPEGEGS